MFVKNDRETRQLDRQAIRLLGNIVADSLSLTAFFISVSVCPSVRSWMCLLTHIIWWNRKTDGQTGRRDSNIVAADSSEVVHSHSVWVLCGRINISLRIYIHDHPTHPTHSYERTKSKSGEKVMLYFASSLFICLRLINITKWLRCSIYKCVSNPYLCQNLQNLANSVRCNGNRTNK